MPNWCSNTINITGPKDKIKALWDQAQKPEEEGGGLLRGLRPEPDYENTEVMSTYGDGPSDTKWWDWRVQNWGTKWEVGSDGLEYSEDGDTATISGWFDSAWSPPCDACEYYLTDNEDVTITLFYYEPGMCFVGKWEDGIDDYFEYSGCDSKTVRDFIGEELDDHWNISEELAQYEAEEEENE